MNLDDLKIDKEIDVLLSPKNEAELPELARVQLVQQIPSQSAQVFIGKLLQQTKQDFGYQVGELLLIKITLEDNSYIAFCTESLLEASLMSQV